VRPFVDPAPSFIPKCPVVCRTNLATNYNLLDMEGAQPTVSKKATPVMPNNATEVFEECLACLDMFEQKLNIDQGKLIHVVHPLH